MAPIWLPPAGLTQTFPPPAALVCSGQHYPFDLWRSFAQGRG